MDALVRPAPDQTTALGAKWLWCPEQGLMADKWLVCEGGLIREICDSPPAGAIRQDLGPGILMPGLVNAHTHLELSFMAGLLPPSGDFVDWVSQLVALRPGHDEQTAAAYALAAAQASASQGVCLAGDISNTGRAIPAWHEAGISAVTFWEALGARQIGPGHESLDWREGLLSAQAMAAHAPYSVPGPNIKRLKQAARLLPFCIHLAESRAEAQLFSGQGADGERLAAFLRGRGVDLDALQLSGDSPLEHLFNLGAVNEHSLLVHGVQIEPDQIPLLAASGASLCVCPRSNLGLTGSMAPVPRLLEAGVNLALGTDSLASSPDLSLWAEMRTLLARFNGIEPELVLHMATLGGARALGLADHFGSLTPHKKAALCYRAAPLADRRGLIEAVIMGA